MTKDEIVLGLPGYQITTIDIEDGKVRVVARYEGARTCPHCGGTRLRSKGIYQRRLRHQDLGLRHSILVVEANKWRCLECGHLADSASVESFLMHQNKEKRPIAESDYGEEEVHLGPESFIRYLT